MGKHYVLTGESGSGKSLFMDKLAPMKENGVDAVGEISYPRVDGHSPKICSVPQEDYIPMNMTLSEVILYPSEAATDAKEYHHQLTSVIRLLRELEVEPASSSNIISALESTGKDWSAILSGGQKKKVAVASSIMQNADIYLLDEVLTGLDKRSVQLVLKVYNNYAKGKLIVAIDHHPEENNYGGFYDYRIHLSNQRLEFLSIQAKQEFLEEAVLGYAIYPAPELACANDPFDALLGDVCISSC
jgi:ABC-type multidrug transport system ATPase subunit